MFLKKLSERKPVTIDYVKNGRSQTIKGRVYCLNLREQILSLKDEQQNSFTIRLSGIRKVY
ncbi:YolD-like family protein [Neobacillus sp. MM2021_6]|uniref:YolD-like family protein n=1 Tax=Bacillaceae TaxID=186817 RepID=UPI00140D6044|nr:MULTISPECIES: YolD-like family protein [Bacillaceae]MBO0961386.1 YolD-like family protein [Neobacillus sp. MM2021_6]NHC20555.1 hypothetical protein [Bacillus sp. MM2020_4]